MISARAESGEIYGGRKITKSFYRVHQKPPLQIH